MKKTYLIAGLKVELTGNDTLQLVTTLPGFSKFEVNSQNDVNADICIHLDKNVDASYFADINLIHKTKMLDAEHTFSKHTEGYLYEIHRSDGHKIACIAYNSFTNEVCVSPCSCEMSAKYVMWVAYTLPAVGKKVIPIHASSVVKESATVLFLGESGTGKSTHAKLWMQYISEAYLLNDDSPLLRIEDGKVYVCGSPWSGKTHCYKQEMHPLKAIVRLSQYPGNRVNRSNKLASIGAIQPSFPPFLAYDESFSEKIADIMNYIIKDIPVYRLKCTPQRQAAEMIFSAIY